MYDDFIEISKYAGMRPDLVQAGGGNSSVKIDATRMVIKASGYSLSDLTSDSGFSIIDYQSLVHGIAYRENENELLLKSIISGKRPSIESFLHALTRRVTLHTHPTLVNVLSVRRDGFERLRALFPDAILVDYVTPGIHLAKLLNQQLQNSASRDVQIIFLKNHGLVVSADDSQRVIFETDNVVENIASYLKVEHTDFKNIYSLYRELRSFNLVDFEDVLYMSTDSFICEFLKNRPLGWSYEFCPDCLVYCHRKMMNIPDLMSREYVRGFISQWGTPNIFIHRQHLYIAAKNIKKARDIESVLRTSAEIAKLNEGEDIDYLSEDEQNFILGWESEKYRQRLGN